jgi:hypothetical protein
MMNASHSSTFINGMNILCFKDENYTPNKSEKREFWSSDAPFAPTSVAYSSLPESQTCRPSRGSIASTCAYGLNIALPTFNSL